MPIATRDAKYLIFICVDYSSSSRDILSLVAEQKSNEPRLARCVRRGEGYAAGRSKRLPDGRKSTLATRSLNLECGNFGWGE